MDKLTSYDICTKYGCLSRIKLARAISRSRGCHEIETGCH